MVQPSRQAVGTSNRLLDALPAAERGRLAAAARQERPKQGLILGSRANPATELWFPHGGVISLSLTDPDGRQVQTGLLGREGCVGLEALFHGMPPLADATVQISGPMSVIPAAAVQAVLASRPQAQAALSEFLFALAAQCLQTVACNRLHTLEQRCCRWLLMLLDRTGDLDLPLTQDMLATMLGSGRPRINALLAQLEADGLLQRFRGRVHLLSRRNLEARTCECYRLLA